MIGSELACFSLLSTNALLIVRLKQEKIYDDYYYYIKYTLLLKLQNI
jgi:hypothetical protein